MQEWLASRLQSYGADGDVASAYCITLISQLAETGVPQTNDRDCPYRIALIDFLMQSLHSEEQADALAREIIMRYNKVNPEEIEQMSDSARATSLIHGMQNVSISKGKPSKLSGQDLADFYPEPRAPQQVDHIGSANENAVLNLMRNDHNAHTTFTPPGKGKSKGKQQASANEHAVLNLMRNDYNANTCFIPPKGKGKSSRTPPRSPRVPKPIFCGIELPNIKNLHSALHLFAKQYCSEYNSPPPLPDNLINQKLLHWLLQRELASGKFQWQSPRRPHVTTRFFGDRKGRDCALTEVEEKDIGTAYEMYATHIIYVEEVVVCAAVQFKTPPQHVAADQPHHITLAYCPPWRPVDAKKAVWTTTQYIKELACEPGEITFLPSVHLRDESSGAKTERAEKPWLEEEKVISNLYVLPLKEKIPLTGTFQSFDARSCIITPDSSRPSSRRSTPSRGSKGSGKGKSKGKGKGKGKRDWPTFAKAPIMPPRNFNDSWDAPPPPPDFVGTHPANVGAPVQEQFHLSHTIADHILAPPSSSEQGGWDTPPSVDAQPDWGDSGGQEEGFW